MSEHEDDKRYFIVYFSGMKGKQIRKGKIHLYTENFSYINEKWVHDTVEKEFKLTEPYITNIQELDEEDFLDFISTGEESENHIDHKEFL